MLHCHCQIYQNVFIGENGMGKTTILNCLYNILTGEIEKLNEIEFESISIIFQDDLRISIFT